MKIDIRVSSEPFWQGAKNMQQALFNIEVVSCRL